MISLNFYGTNQKTSKKWESEYVLFYLTNSLKKEGWKFGTKKEHERVYFSTNNNNNNNSKES